MTYLDRTKNGAVSSVWKSIEWLFWALSFTSGKGKQIMQPWKASKQFVVCVIVDIKKSERGRTKPIHGKRCQLEGGGLPTIHVQQGGGNQKVSRWISWRPKLNKTQKLFSFVVCLTRICLFLFGLSSCAWVLLISRKLGGQHVDIASSLSVLGFFL